MRLSYAIFFLLLFVIYIRPNAYGKVKIQTNLSYKLVFKETSTDTINTKNINPKEIISYAKTLLGTPYKYGSINPKAGFDCSGFITYVFNHFNIKVPRSSKDFTHIPREINIAEAEPGDLILFTGTNSNIKTVGHMGIILSNDNECRFIHCSSGKVRGVIITPLNKYYLSRFLKIIRIFKQNDLP